jgi:hypothetical protein
VGTNFHYCQQTFELTFHNHDHDHLFIFMLPEFAILGELSLGARMALYLQSLVASFLLERLLLCNETPPVTPYPKLPP